MKNKKLFVIVAISLLAATFLIRRFLPNPLNEYSGDLIAITALLIVLWEKIFKIQPKPIRKYSVDPQKLKGRNFNPFKLEAFITNSGDVPISIKFAWVDYGGNIRFNFVRLEDSTGRTINNSFRVEPKDQKDVVVVFQTEEGGWTNEEKNIKDAIRSKDERILEFLTHKQARLVWSDVTDRSQERNMPLGFWFKELAIDIIKNPTSRVVDL